MDVLKKIPVRKQGPRERATNFKKVCLGYNQEEAQEEAQCCINCENAKCVRGCPVAINIPKFISEVEEGEFGDAASAIIESSALPAVHGCVYPQESQREEKHIRGIRGESISIRRLKRLVVNWSREHEFVPAEPDKTNGMKVAVTGSGPAGLTCARNLAKMGCEMATFEASHKPGSALTHGVPELRLPESGVVQPEIDNVRRLGAKMEASVIIGKSVTIDELMDGKGFKAVFIGSGTGLPKSMKISRESASGVFSANEYLTRGDLIKVFRDSYDTPIYLGKRVAVVGGGSVAMDVARTALRLGAEVYIIYRRSEVKLPARMEEVHYAGEEGIILNLLTNPVEILTDDNGWVRGMVVRKMELSKPDVSGRCRPVEIAGPDYAIDVDAVVMPPRTPPNPSISSTTEGLGTDRWKCIITDKFNGKTTKEGVYAGGDVTTGVAAVILAMKVGRAGAKGINESLRGSE